MSTHLATEATLPAGNNESWKRAYDRCEILGVPVDLVDYETAFAMMHQWRSCGDRRFVALATAADIQMSRDRHVRAASRCAALSLPDGVSIDLAAKLFGYQTSGRVTGPELMLKICDWGRTYAYRHYFYGSTDVVVRGLCERLTKRYPGLDIAGHYCPPFRALTPEEDEQVVRCINACRPDVVWVGLGGTKQLCWMADHVTRVRAPMMVGVGAAFDFHSGAVKWAPAWMRRCGMEWIHRMLTEPRKILPRTRHTLMFGTRVLAQAIAWRLTGKTGMYKGNPARTNARA